MIKCHKFKNLISHLEMARNHISEITLNHNASVFNSSYFLLLSISRFKSQIFNVVSGFWTPLYMGYIQYMK